ncbi:esterase [Mangrovibacter yixingensis]|uniref:esterase n=1 Tax=Mangrovibacter yixingensis TaxID=1529639 RepID=UPI001CFEFED9|nr:esterase [Mangrovibacter yixingensis]
MTEIETTNLAGFEVLHAAPSGKRLKPLPTIIFWHGYTSSKLVYSYFAVALAQAGFRVVMPDAPEHGARFHGDDAGRLQRFWQILYGNIQEYPLLRDAIEAKGWVAEGRLGVAGASMGAMTALGVAGHYPEVRCTASLMGSGFYHTLSQSLFPPPAQHDAVLAPLANYEATQCLAMLASRPLMLWHGEDDDLVPAAESKRLWQLLQQQHLDKHVACYWESGVKHRITPFALDSTCEFFRQSL